MRSGIARLLAGVAVAGVVMAWSSWIAGRIVGSLAVMLIAPFAMLGAVAVYPRSETVASPPRLSRRLVIAASVAVVLVTVWVGFVRYVAPRHDWSSVGLGCPSGGRGATPRAALNRYYRGCLFRPNVRGSERVDHPPYEEAVAFSIEKRRDGDYAGTLSVLVGRMPGTETWVVDRSGERPTLNLA